MKMNYDEWESGVPVAITGDSLWKMKAYRLALFLGDIAWRDVNKLMQDKRTTSVADQLYRSVGSIGANLAEGYSRGTGRDRARFYEYALGSVRESKDWYYKGRHILGEGIVDHRLNLLVELNRLLLAMVPQQRRQTLRENSTDYKINNSHAHNSTVLLNSVPFSD
jgi:four helix bundle protein